MLLSSLYRSLSSFLIQAISEGKYLVKPISLNPYMPATESGKNLRVTNVAADFLIKHGHSPGKSLIDEIGNLEMKGEETVP